MMCSFLNLHLEEITVGCVRPQRVSQAMWEWFPTSTWFAWWCLVVSKLSFASSLKALASFWFMVIYQNMSCHQPNILLHSQTQLGFFSSIIFGASQDFDSCIVSFKKKQLLLRFLAGFTLQSDPGSWTSLGFHLSIFFPASSWPNPENTPFSPRRFPKEKPQRNQPNRFPRCFHRWKSPGSDESIDLHQQQLWESVELWSTWLWKKCGTIFFFS